MVTGSEIDLQDIASEQEDLEVDDAGYEIRTMGADYTLELYSQKITTNEIKIPDFQRKYVWTLKRASKLIESFLLGLPVPQVFLFQEGKSRDLLVVDGQQRLLSVHYFLTGGYGRDRARFALKGVKQQWEGKTFEELDETDKRKLKNYILRATIFEQINPDDNKSVYEIFERLNTGGVALSEQEIRNCVNNGPINAFLDDLNSDSNWRRIMGTDEPDIRMKDIELVLRFLALYDTWNSYAKPMKDFISDYMEKMVSITPADQHRLKSVFSRVTEALANAGGKSAVSFGSSRINVAMLDSVMVAIALNEGLDSSELADKLTALKANTSFRGYVSDHTTDDDTVKGRIRMCMEAFK